MSALAQTIQGNSDLSADEIQQVYQQHFAQPHFIADIINCLQHTTEQRVASALLKTHLQSHHQLTIADIHRIYQTLTKLEHWESRLHILQSIPFMPIASADRKMVENFLRINLTDNNKFVRAWSYNGFYELTLQYPQYRAEVEQFLEMGARDEPASVKARIRNIMKKGFPED